MKVFKFRFETLLRHRLREEEQASAAVAEHVAACGAIRRRIEQHRQAGEQAVRQITASLHGAVDVEALRDSASYAAKMRVLCAREAMKLRDAEVELEKIRAALRVCMQRRRAIELLRDRDKAAWRREMLRKEAAVFDELSNQRYAHLREEAPA